MISRWYRFRAVADVNAVIIYVNDLIGIAGAMCTVANSTLSMLSQAMQVKKVRIWNPANADATVDSAKIAWYAQNNGLARSVGAATSIVARPAYIETAPRLGDAAFYRISAQASVGLFEITASSGALIDVLCTHWLNNSGTAGVTYTVAAATLGVVYYLPLDGDSDQLVNVGLPSTT